MKGCPVFKSALPWLVLTLLLVAGRVRADFEDGQANHAMRLAIYAVRYTDTRFLGILQGHVDARNAYAAAFAVSRRVRKLTSALELDGELQVAGHWGRQDHWEVNAALMARWTRFPWSRRLSTTIAYGLGPSIALSTPLLEREAHDRTSRRLVFMPFEITAGTPDRRLEAFLRVHHRSGAFDVISRGGGSNLVGAGVRMHW